MSELERFYVRYFDDETVTVVERLGCEGLEDRVVCDFLCHDHDQLRAKAETDAELVCRLLNEWEAARQVPA